jgi:thioester reductase-like protein
MSYLLLTGATGLLGRYLLRDLLLEGQNLAVLVRPGKLAMASDRVESVMQYWENLEGRSLPRPIVISGDLREPNLGVSEVDRAWIGAHCDAVLHSAASMVFRAQTDGEPNRTNVEGTRALLELCRDAGIRRFHHVSTAYLCGLRTGRVLETELDLGQELGNVYEASKLAAEKLIRDAQWLDQATFYRPASILGDSRTGYTVQYHGFYLPLQLAYTMSGRIPPEEMGDRFFRRLGLEGHEGKNFVPADWVAAAISYIYLHPEFHGGTYHLSSPQPVRVQIIQQVIQDAIRGYSKRTTATRADERDLRACEQLFHQHMQIYQSHWRDDPEFDRTHADRVLAHLPCPRMDYERMLQIARYPIEQNFATPKHVAVRVDCDVQALIDRLALPAGNVGPQVDGRLLLHVNGSGGGQWTLTLAGSEVVAAQRGECGDTTNVCYLNTKTLGHLIQGDLTIDEAIRTGRLVLEAPAGGHRRLLDVMHLIVGTISLSAA